MYSYRMFSESICKRERVKGRVKGGCKEHKREVDRLWRSKEELCNGRGNEKNMFLRSGRRGGRCITTT